MINAIAVPRKAVHTRSNETGERVNTIAGKMKTSKMFKLRNIKLSKFDQNCRIEGVKTLMLENDCKYDVIFGSEFLNMIGMDIRYSIGEMEWYNNTFPMREPWDISNKDYVQMCDTYHIHDEDDFLEMTG